MALKKNNKFPFPPRSSWYLWLLENVKTHLESENRDSCLLWPYGKMASGRGYVIVEGKLQSAHIFAYQRFIRDITDKEQIIQTCDRRDCINPLHSKAEKIKTSKQMLIENILKHLKSPDKHKCLEWRYRNGAKVENTYGQLWVTVNGVAKCRRASGVAYEIFLEKKNPLNGRYVLHKCDNRPCYNPLHLFPGTQVENIKDMVAKNRQWRPAGKLNPKLTQKVVEAIRADYDSGAITDYAELEAKYQLGQKLDVIERIVKRLTYNNPQKGTSTKLSEEQLAEVDALKASGWSHGAISRKFGVTVTTISNLLKRQKRQ